MSPTPALRSALTPTGKLRASINLGNPILAGRDADGNPYGVSVDLAGELARALGVELELAVFDAAGVKQQLEQDAAQADGLGLLNERFMVIRQAMGTPKTRSPEAMAFLAAFVERMKASGFVARALQRHGIQGASVAPAA